MGIGRQVLGDIDTVLADRDLDVYVHQGAADDEHAIARQVRRHLDFTSESRWRHPCRTSDLDLSWDPDHTILRWTCGNCPRTGYGVRALEDHTMWPRLVDNARTHVLGYRPCRPRVIQISGPHGGRGWTWLCPLHLAFDVDELWDRATVGPGSAHDAARAHVRTVETGDVT